MGQPSPYDNVIDSRDVIKAIEDMRHVCRGYDEAYEYAKLVELHNECKDSVTDWYHGEALISDDHWTEWVEQFAKDTGAVSSDAEWPYNFIDWEAAGEAIQNDYMLVTYDGQDFWVRA